MSFFGNHEWQLIFLFTSLIWILLLLREIYRFRLLVTQYGKITIGIVFVLVIIWISLFFYMCYRVSILAGIFSFGILFLATSVILGIMRVNKSSQNTELYDSVLGKTTEMEAKFEWQEKFKQSIIEKLTKRSDLADILSEYNLNTDFFQKLTDNFYIGNDQKALKNFSNVNIDQLRAILEMYTRPDWSELDKILGILRYLRGN